MKKQYKYSRKKFDSGVKFLADTFPEFKKLIEKYPVAFCPAIKQSPYISLIRSIAYQQIHIKAAETILQRFFALYPDQEFPSPQNILSTPDLQLRGCGFSMRKVMSIKDIAQKTLEGVVPTLEEAGTLSDQELIDRLVVIYGIGKWSVEMLLIFQLGRLDVWPVDDFGMRKGHQLWKKMKIAPSIKELQEQGKQFSPYRSIVALYLWQVSNADTQAKKKK